MIKHITACAILIVERISLALSTTKIWNCHPENDNLRRLGEIAKLRRITNNSLDDIRVNVILHFTRAAWYWRSLAADAEVEIVVPRHAPRIKDLASFL
jgi:hypothetical protein